MAWWIVLLDSMVGLWRALQAYGRLMVGLQGFAWALGMVRAWQACGGPCNHCPALHGLRGFGFAWVCFAWAWFGCMDLL
jgi:hypothetical protein|tara:strand:+ start:3030 stop:3266 length:237 start_codon:yes stop_codon:yes gene_type:complete